MEYDKQLKKILDSPSFSKSKRLSVLFTYLVHNTVYQNNQDIKEITIAIDVFGMGSDFNPSENPIVRVSIARLRKRLCYYYRTYGEDDDIEFKVLKGNYRVIAIPRCNGRIVKSTGKNRYKYTDYEITGRILINTPKNVKSLEECELAIRTLRREIPHINHHSWFLVQLFDKSLGNYNLLDVRRGVEYLKEFKRNGCCR